jgi:hypothetical protein
MFQYTPSAIIEPNPLRQRHQIPIFAIDVPFFAIDRRWPAFLACLLILSKVMQWSVGVFPAKPGSRWSP